MEDVLDLYEEPYDAKRPVVCFDEKPLQLLAHTRQPRPVRPGQAGLTDHEYKREGTANIFMAVEPLAGWRHVDVTQQRTKLDFAAQMKQLADVHYPEAKLIRIVLDNLNTHKRASLYDAYAPEEAQRILRRLEFHHTPKHASWLNAAEIEIGALDRQCLDRRISKLATLACETAAWEQKRNQERVTINWRFTARDARKKLPHLYPEIPSTIKATEY